MPERSEPESSLSESIDRILGIVQRGRWWVLTAACAIPMALVPVAMRLPDRYVSQATLLVEQQVPQRYVASDSATTAPSALQSTKLEVLSRVRLLRIINELGLYRSAKDRSPELLVDKMLQDIDIRPVEGSRRDDLDAFIVSFTAETPHLAQEVTSRLASSFIEQNLRTRGEQAAMTTKFLTERLQAAKQRLAEQEQRLQAFKSSNLGELPEQQQTNLATLTEIREQLQTVSVSLLAAQQRQESIEAPLAARLDRLRSERAELLTHYTSRYPEVVKRDRDIATVEGFLAVLRNGRRTSGHEEDVELPDDPAIEGIFRQAEANAAQIASLTKQQQKLNAEVELYQKRLNLTPLREQQLAEILRDYNLFKQDYSDLQNKKLQSELTTSLEEHQEGQQFRLVDPPTLPIRPSSPKRSKFCFGGMAGGLGVGLALAFLIDKRNGSFQTEKALCQQFSLPLVLGIPFVLTASERRARRWKMALEWVAGSVMMLTMFAAEFYVYRVG